MIKYVLCIVILFLMISCESESEKKQRLETLRLADSTRVAQKKLADSLANKWVSGEVKAGQGLFQVMLDMKMNVSEALKLLNELTFAVELKNLRAGQKVQCQMTHDGRPLVFKYKPDRIETHIMTLDTLSKKWSYQLEEAVAVERYRVLQGVLKSGASLNSALGDNSLPNSVVQVASNALLSKISFSKDARMGDQFALLLKETFVRDTIISGRTQVLFAAYNGERTGRHEAFWFQDKDLKSSWTAHYTEKGEPLQSAGLRFPVDRIHIVSTFGIRIDPITGLPSMHAGVDYASPSGTPVYAVAKGVVVQVGYDGGSGNKIGIKHADGTQSYYYHLSRQLVRVGQSVTPRQVIGRVGSTGRSTGPHLHLGFKNVKGSWINPSGKRMIAAQKLDSERLAEFKKQVIETRHKLDSLKRIN